MIFVEFLQLTLRSRWQALHLPSTVMTRGRALVPAPVWRPAHSGKERESPSREKTMILLVQIQDLDQGRWVQWTLLTSCRRAEGNLKRFFFSSLSLRSTEKKTFLLEVNETNDMTNRGGSHQQVKFIYKDLRHAEYGLQAKHIIDVRSV